MKRLINTLTATRKRKFALVAVTAVAATTAYAAWLVDGEGPGHAEVGTLAAPTVQAGGLDPSAKRCLAGATCDGTFQITNDNGTALVLTGATAASSQVGESSSPGCAANYLEVPVKTGLSIPIPAGTTTVKVPDVFRLRIDAPTACQGASIDKRVKLSFSTPTS
jgi:hypothetical protein